MYICIYVYIYMCVYLYICISHMALAMWDAAQGGDLLLDAVTPNPSHPYFTESIN